MGLGPIVKFVGKGLFSALDTKAGAPTARSLAGNAQNDLDPTLFYSANPIKRGLGMGIGMLKTGYSSAREQLDPRLLKMRETTGISDRTKTQVDNQLNKLDMIRSDMKDADVFTQKVGNRRTKDLTREEKELRKEYLKQEKNPSKIISGQMLYQTLANKQQGVPNPILDEMLPENFLGSGMLIDANGNINVEDFIKIKNFKGWETEGKLGEGRMKTMLDKILKVNEPAIPKGKPLQYYVRQDAASDATGNMVFEMQSAPRMKQIGKILQDRGTLFDNVDDMANYLRKELETNPKYVTKKPKTNRFGLPVYRKDKKGNRIMETEDKQIGVGGSWEVRDGAIWFDDSFKSSDYSLGGVNVMNFLEVDGTRGSMISDINDIAGMAMPSGDNAMTLSLPKLANMYVKKDQNQTQAQYNKKVEETLKRLGAKTKAKQKQQGKNKQTAERKEQLREGRIKEEQRARVEAIIPREVSERGTKYSDAYTDLINNYRAGTLSVAQTKVARDIQALDIKFEDLTMKDWMKYLAKIGVVGGGAIALTRGED